MDFAKTAHEIVEQAGGKENVNTVTHCMTRLRFTVKDKKKVNFDEIKKIDGVLGCVYGAEQAQVIMGKNLVATYNEVLKQYDFTVVDAIDENLDDLPAEKEKLTLKSAGNKVLGYVAASVSPMIPALIAGGMLKVALLIVTLIWDGFDATSTYILLSQMANAPFYFMPIMVAYGASKKLGGNPAYAMMVAAAMMCPDFLNMVAEGTPVTLFGVPVLLKSYTSSLLPSLLLALAAVNFEKLFDKIVPGIFKSIFVGMLTFVCTYFLTMVLLAPIGTYVGNYIVAGLVWIQSTIGPVALALLTGILPFLIMTGVHTLFGPFMVQSLAEVGYDGFFRPALLLHNMAEGGACLGVAIKAKDKDLKSEAFSCAVGCIFAGVTEPAIYGINLRLKKPLYAVCAGGAIAGLIGGLFSVKAFVMGYSSLLALPIFESTIVGMSIAIVAAIIASCIFTLVLGFDERNITG